MWGPWSLESVAKRTCTGVVYSEVLRGTDSGTRELITATAEQLPSCGRLDTLPSGKTSYSLHMLLRGDFC